MTEFAAGVHGGSEVGVGGVVVGLDPVGPLIVEGHGAVHEEDATDLVVALGADDVGDGGGKRFEGGAPSGDVGGFAHGCGKGRQSRPEFDFADHLGQADGGCFGLGIVVVAEGGLNGVEGLEDLPKGGDACRVGG